MSTHEDGVLFRLIYLSQSNRPCDTERLLEIAEQARPLNAAARITGVLVHSSGHFLQVLEGSPGQIATLYAHLHKDDRHFDLRCLSFAPCMNNARLYPKWSMGAYDLGFSLEKPDFEQVWTALGRGAGVPSPDDITRAIDAFAGQSAAPAHPQAA